MGYFLGLPMRSWPRCFGAAVQGCKRRAVSAPAAIDEDSIFIVVLLIKLTIVIGADLVLFR